MTIFRRLLRTLYAWVYGPPDKGYVSTACRNFHAYKAGKGGYVPVLVLVTVLGGSACAGLPTSPTPPYHDFSCTPRPDNPLCQSPAPALDCVTRAPLRIITEVSHNEYVS